MTINTEAKELLRAAFQLIHKQDKSPYVLNVQSQTVMLDKDTEVDGASVMDMISEFLEDNEVDPYELDNDNTYC